MGSEDKPTKSHRLEKEEERVEWSTKLWWNKKNAHKLQLSCIFGFKCAVSALSNSIRWYQCWLYQHFTEIHQQLKSVRHNPLNVCSASSWAGVRVSGSSKMLSTHSTGMAYQCQTSWRVPGWNGLSRLQAKPPVSSWIWSSSQELWQERKSSLNYVEVNSFLRICLWVLRKNLCTCT